MSNPVPIKSGYEGSVKEQISNYFQSVKAGNVGALPAIGALIVLTILFSSLSPYFFTTINIANLFVQSAVLITTAAALVFVILIGEIDLSAGVTAGTAMAVFVKLNNGGMDWPLAFALGFSIGIVTGITIGWFVARIGVPSFVISLAFMLGFPGVMLLVLGTGGVLRLEVPELKAIMNSNMPVWAGWLMLAICIAITAAMGLWDRSRRKAQGVPVRPIAILWAKVISIAILGGAAVWYLNLPRNLVPTNPIQGVPVVVPILLVLLFAGTFVLDRTKYGRHLYAVGGNPEAARRAGIKVAAVRIWAFVICSLLATIGGVFNVSRIGNVESSAGRFIVLSAVAAAVVGGVSLFGGKGRLSWAVVGALAIAMIENGLGLLGLPAGFTFVVTGVVLALAATVDAVARKKSGSSLVRL
jgi:D-xylose transport system permease protein